MLKVGLLGYGRFGKIHHKKLSALADIQYMGYFDPQYPSTVPFDLKSFVALCDAVIIATPIDTHYRLGKYVLQQKKHCFIEKPLCLDINEALKLYNLAKDLRLVLQVGHIERYAATTQNLPHEISNSLTVYRTTQNPCTNILFDVVIHDFDLLYQRFQENLSYAKYTSHYLTGRTFTGKKIQFNFMDNHRGSPLRIYDFNGEKYDLSLANDPLKLELVDFITRCENGEKFNLLGDWSAIQAIAMATRIKNNHEVKVWHYTNIYPSVLFKGNCKIGSYTEIGEKVIIGQDVDIGAHCFIPEGVEIEDDCFIGPRVTFTNDMYPPSGQENWSKTIVKKGARIGAGVCVRPGITIGEGALIGTGAVVVSDVKPYSVVAGNPGKVLYTLH